MLQAALARGHGRGKPVLVLRVPEQDRVERGEMLGALLHGASRALLEALPLAELVCARRTDLAALRPGWRLEREPLAWLVEARGADPRARAIDPALEEAPGSARLAPLDGTLVGALVGDEALVHQRAAAVNAAGTFRVPARTRLLAEPLEASFEAFIMLLRVALSKRFTVGAEDPVARLVWKVSSTMVCAFVQELFAATMWESNCNCWMPSITATCCRSAASNSCSAARWYTFRNALAAASLAPR